MLMVGVGLLFYPTVADLWNSHVQSRVVVSYAETVEQMPAERKEFLLNRARRYNAELVEDSDRWQPSEADLAEYEDELDVTGDGVMAYVEIPKIDVNLPVYHGTSEAVLTVGIGHIEGSSLPVGGPGTHAVISGHRGLPSARLFTDIDRLSAGDRFYLHVLDQTLAYEVDQVLTVEPGDFSALEIDEGSDLCTLVTCTPYGINTHRLLVRGHRVELEEGEAAGGAPAADNRALWLAAAMAALAGVAVGAAAITRRRGAGGCKGARRGAGGREGTRHGRY